MIRRIGDDLFVLTRLASGATNVCLFIKRPIGAPPERCVGLGGARPQPRSEANMLPQRCVKKLAFGCGRCEICAKSGFGRDKFLRRHRYFRAHLSAHQIFSKTIMRTMRPRTILTKIAAFYAIYLLFSKF